MFKDSLGRWRTTSLFYETNGNDADQALFTLGKKDLMVDGKTLISIRKRYIESNDPTGYRCAEEYLGGYSHWKALLRSRIRDQIAEWEEEQEKRMRSLGFKKIMEANDKGVFQASRFLVEKGWKAKPTSKASKEKEENFTAQMFAQYEGDARRLSELQ